MTIDRTGWSAALTESQVAGQICQQCYQCFGVDLKKLETDPVAVMSEVLRRAKETFEQNPEEAKIIRERSQCDTGIVPTWALCVLQGNDKDAIGFIANDAAIPLKLDMIAVWNATLYGKLELPSSRASWERYDEEAYAWCLKIHAEMIK